MRSFPYLLAFLLASGCAGDRSRPVRIDTPTVVVISVDTLRADRLPAYGYRGVKTPQIDALARQSVLFERAYSHCPLTLPSHASILTGLLPPEHGVRTNKGYALDAQAVTLAERLAGAGYRAAGFVSSMVLRRGTGIEQGFDHYQEPAPQPGLDPRQAFAQQRGEHTLAAARAWLSGRAPDEKLFVFFHVFDPHSPYDAPPPFAGADAYDAEVAYTDSVVGGLLDTLRGLGRLDDALVVFLSDHGEGLGDHVEKEHGIFLYRETLQVPLLVKLPGAERAGDRVPAPVALSDVAPTVLALLGLERAGMAGTALFDGPPPTDRTIYAESAFGYEQYGWSPLASALRESLHYIRAPRAELYDLAADPHERANLLPGRAVPETLSRTVAEVGQGKRTTVAVSPEQAERLAALGYVGGSSSAPAATANLPDPKDRVADAMELWSLMDQVGKSPSAEAELRMKELLGRTGLRREELSRTVAGNLLRAGRLPAAHEVLDAHRESSDPETLLLRGEILAGLGRHAEARGSFDRVLARHPEHAAAHRNVGILLLGQGRPAEARRWLEKAVALDPGQALAWNGLGVVFARAGDAKGAVASWRRAVEADPRLSDAWYNLARTLAGLGEREAARAAVERYAALAEGAERARALALLSRLGPGG